jgi:hypothetical protein
MSKIPSARVVRGGEGRGGQEASGETAPKGRVLRFAPRLLPRALVWQLIFGGPPLKGWMLAAFGMIFPLAPDFRLNSEGITLLVFLIGGLAFLVWTLPPAVRKVRLLRYGTETSGKLIGNGETVMHIDNVPVMELTFEYEVSGNIYVTTVLIPRPEPLEDDDREAILYDPMAPARAATLGRLIGPKLCSVGDGLTPHTYFEIRPALATITAGGEFEARTGIAFNLLILPPVLFVGLVVAAVIRLI